MNKRLIELVHYLESGLIERAVPVRLSLLAALSGEHILLLGPPGTAKSELARKLHQVFTDAKYFERLLTRFSVPEELFGPLSIKALEDDRYHRLTTSYLPDANVAFIDEIFKSNSAILNSLLTILNEREFDNGCVRVKTPLICVVAASNEMPDDVALEALYDRFLIRFQVKPVSDAGFSDLLKLTAESTQAAATGAIQPLNVSDIESIQALSAKVSLDEASESLMQRLRLHLKEQSIYISDRRWRKALKILQVCAHTSNRQAVSVWDCTLLTHIMWQSPEQLDALNDWFINELKLDVDTVVLRLQKLVSTWESRLDEDRQKFTQQKNSKGEPLYKMPSGKVTTQHEHIVFAERQGESLYLAPPDIVDRTNSNTGYTLEELESGFFDKSYKQTHVDGRWIDVQNYINNTQNKLIERCVFEPVVEAFYFSREYVSNQFDDLDKALEAIALISGDFERTASNIEEVLKDNVWLSCGLLDKASDRIVLKMPELVELQQRLIELKKFNSELSVQ